MFAAGSGTPSQQDWHKHKGLDLAQSQGQVPRAAGPSPTSGHCKYPKGAQD